MVVGTEDAVETGVNREKRITQMKLDQLREKVQEFEKEYEMDSDEFRDRFETGELGDDKDFMEWDVYLDLIEQLEQKKKELSRFKK